jgi:hypothetical protein
VDGQRFAGTCYRAANWIPLGQTQGRGRMDRYHQADGSAHKLVFVYSAVMCSGGSRGPSRHASLNPRPLGLDRPPQAVNHYLQRTLSV